MLCLFALTAAPALAADIVVNTADDENNSDGDCSLREAVQAANTNAAVDACTAGDLDGDTITFSSAFTIVLTQGELLVSDDVIINGSSAGGVTVDAQGNSRAFNVDVTDGDGFPGSASAVAFQSLVLTNGNSTVNSAAPDAGGGVDIKGDDDVTFTDVDVTNSVAGLNGGGIHAGGGTTLVITTTDDGSSLIDGNDAQGDDAGMGGGGVWGAGSTTISGNVTISNNMASGTSGSGGGVLNFGGTTDITEGVVISSNSANRAGGGVENFDGDGDGDHTVNLTGVTLDQNFIATANPGNGGGLHSGGGTVNVSDGIVTNNTATEGGGLWTSGVLDVMDGTLIDSNEGTGDDAAQGGGGIYNEAGTVNVSGGVTISNNTASGAAGSGGGILNNGRDGDATLMVMNSEISGNAANRAGGGVEDALGTATLTGVTLSGNSIATAAPGNGGGLHSGGGDVTVSGGSVTGNTAVEGGGLWSNGTLSVTDGTLIDDNEATGDDATQGGGGVYIESGGSATLSGATISNNSASGDAGSGGGLLVSDSSSASVTGGEISGNSANRAGGGIEVSDDPATTDGATSVTLSQVSVTGNDAGDSPGNGGGIHIGGAGQATVSRSTFSGNEAAEGAGLWASASSTLDVDLSTVSGNSASGDGGGVYDDGGATVMLTSATVVQNSAGADGGGLLGTSGAFAFGNTILANNTAGGSGPDASGTFTSNDFNLIEDTSGYTFAGGPTANTITGQDPMLGPLADNGGPTLTHLPQDGSPVIDAGSNLSGEDTDQRGEERTVDNDPDNASDGTDIGSVERGADMVADTTPPVCGDIAFERNDENQISAVVTSASDEESGIASVQFTRLRNLDGFVDGNGPFAEGETYTTPDPDPNTVEIRGERISFSQGGALVTLVTNGAGLTSQCDPVLETISSERPAAFALKGNYPNPVAAGSGTTIEFAIAEASEVTLEVYDVLGRKVATLVGGEEMAPATYRVRWNAGAAMPSGTYIYRLRAGSFTASKQMVLVK